MLGRLTALAFLLVALVITEYNTASLRKPSSEAKEKNTMSKENVNNVIGEISDDMSHEQRLFHHSIASMNEPPSFIQFGLLQKINVIEIQNDLARLMGQIFENRAVSTQTAKDLRDRLHEYATAIRDFKELDTLTELPPDQAGNTRTDLMLAFDAIANKVGNPYSSCYSRISVPPAIPTDPLRDFLKAHLPASLTYTRAQKEAQFDGFLAHNPPFTVSPFVDKLARFVVAFAGGASLVVPMLVMTLPTQTRTKSLVTVSVAVTLFAAVMSLVIRAGNSETIAATATYAAVLVVFVGTSSS